MVPSPAHSRHVCVVICFLQVGDGQLHPALPANCHPSLADLLSGCFDPDPLGRPSFGLIVAQLTWILEDMGKQAAEKQVENAWGRWWGKATATAAAAAAAAPPILKRPASKTGSGLGGLAS